jgi:hypothetical protein
VNVQQLKSEVSPPPKPAARRTLHAVKARPLPFGSWFAQQMQRNDGVGQIARDIGGTADLTFQELLEALAWDPIMGEADFKAAFQAQREYQQLMMAVS